MAQIDQHDAFTMRSTQELIVAPPRTRRRGPHHDRENDTAQVTSQVRRSLGLVWMRNQEWCRSAFGVLACLK